MISARAALFSLPTAFIVLLSAGITRDAAAAGINVAPEPANTESLRSCPAYGDGYLLVPGSRSCVRIGGQITSSYEYNSADDSLYAETLYLAGNPFIIYDAVDSTLPIVSTKVETIVNLTAVTPTEVGPLVSFTSFKGIHSDKGETLGVDQAFMAARGFTFGRRRSFFDFSTGFSFTDGYTSNTITNLVAYTQEVGDKGSVTLSLEDNEERRVDDGVWALRGPQYLPDLVVTARIDDARWGLAQISGAIRKISDDRVTKCCGTPDSRLGWAVSAGLEYRTKIGPYFGRFLFGGAYAEGAVSYLGHLPFMSDYIVDGDGIIVPTRGYSLIASYEHVWREDLKSTVTISGLAARSDADTLQWKPFGILASLGSEYMPAEGLMVGLEASYYVDSGKAIYFGVEGEDSHSDFAKVKAYARRRF